MTRIQYGKIDSSINLRYSFRNACTGSIEAARLAGMKPATDNPLWVCDLP